MKMEQLSLLSCFGLLGGFIHYIDCEVSNGFKVEVVREVLWGRFDS